MRYHRASSVAGYSVNRNSPRNSLGQDKLLLEMNCLQTRVPTFLRASQSWLQPRSPCFHMTSLISPSHPGVGEMGEGR